jgi:predicted alpha/beta-hydrolase family hydrolase
MIENLTYVHCHKTESTTCFLVLHGGDVEGIVSPFISSIITSLSKSGTSVFGFNFPYCERNEESSSGEDLREEICALNNVVDFLRISGYEKINIVAKSLGGIVASFWLEKEKISGTQIFILGYVIGSVKTLAFRNNHVSVIQGQLDKFGDIEKVKDEFRKNNILVSEIVEIPNADHSYRNKEMEPVFQNEAVRQLVEMIGRLH